MSNQKQSLSGLTDEEAQEFHKFYIQGTLAFTATAVIAITSAMPSRLRASPPARPCRRRRAWVS